MQHLPPPTYNLTPGVANHPTSHRLRNAFIGFSVGLVVLSFPHADRIPAATPTPAALPAAAAATPTATAPAPTVASITTWKKGASPLAWAAGRIYYNEQNAAGLNDGYSSLPNGRGAVCVTCGSAYPAGTQHGIADVDAQGRYALTTIERANHPFAVGQHVAGPGQGAFNDLWIQTTDGVHAWQLTNALTSHTNALIWARFDTTGTRVIWSEQWRFGLPFGAWEMHTATIVWRGGVPSLADITTLKTAGLMEAYGFSADGSHVYFAADALAGTPWDDLQIMTMRSDLTGAAVRLSPQGSSDTGYFTNYNEFAFVMPHNGRIIFGRSVGAFYGSLEYWTMNSNGSDPQQLTTMSRPFTSQYRSYPSMVGSLAFDPHNPKRFVAAIETSLSGTYTSVMITLR